MISICKNAITTLPWGVIFRDNSTILFERIAITVRGHWCWKKKKRRRNAAHLQAIGIESHWRRLKQQYIHARARANALQKQRSRFT